MITKRQLLNIGFERDDVLADYIFVIRSDLFIGVDLNPLKVRLYNPMTNKETIILGIKNIEMLADLITTLS